MPFSEPIRHQDHIEEVRKVGRLAQVLLDLRTEYEQRPQRNLLEQIVGRIDELTALGNSLRLVEQEKAPTVNGTGD